MNIKKKLIFVLLLIIVSFVYNYNGILSKDAYSIHQWRQADCLSLTMSYYENNEPFNAPSIYWLGKSNDSHTISEFPLIYFTVAKIWKITGKKIFIFRLINTSIVLIGLFFLFLTIFEILKDYFWSVFIPLFLFTSPILAYYSNNFLMNAPALGFVLIAWYFYVKFHTKDKIKHLLLSLFFFTIAGLLKITSLISFIALLSVYVLNLFKFKFTFDYKLLKKTKSILILSFVVFSIIFSWYFYSNWFNNNHLQGIFLQGFFPIWDLTYSKILLNANKLYNVLSKAYFYSIPLFLFFSLIVYYLLNFKKSNKFHYFLIVSMLIGIVLYILLWFKAFTVHDYYLINLLIIIPIGLCVFLYYLKKTNSKIFYHKKLKIFSAIFLLFLIYNTSVVNRMKYSSSDVMVQNSFVVNYKTMEYWKWYHDNYYAHFKSLSEIEVYLDSIGVQKNDTVISIPDQSINISLYLLGRKGFTDFGYNHLKGYNQRIDYFKLQGAKYLIINDTSIINNTEIKKYTQNLIGTFNNIRIYDLQ